MALLIGGICVVLVPCVCDESRLTEILCPKYRLQKYRPIGVEQKIYIQLNNDYVKGYLGHNIYVRQYFCVRYSDLKPYIPVVLIVFQPESFCFHNLYETDKPIMK